MLPSALLAVMAIDPTPAELRALATVQNVADWCGLQGTATDRATPLGSLFSLLGVTANMQPRVIGFMSAADYRAAVEQWRIGADAATATLPTFRSAQSRWALWTDMQIDRWDRANSGTTSS